MKNLYGMSSLPANVIADTTPEPSENFDHAEHIPEPIHKEIDSEVLGGARDQRMQSLSMMISLFISWMTLLKPLPRHLCHTPFGERGNEASIRVPRLFKSHVWQQYDKQMKCYE
jgi:hypothetical protein